MNPALREIAKLIEKARPGDARDLVYIHIGKCGGSTVNAAIRSSPVIAERFRRVAKVHVRRPRYKPHTRYLFVVRNPISRALSAFNWRYRNLLMDRDSREKFRGERALLERYGTLDNLATGLYRDGELVPEVARDFRGIHHLYEDIAFYLEPARGRIERDQVFAVLCQEFLDEDIERYLGCPKQERLKSNLERMPPEMTRLGDGARENLARFLDRDFAALEWLADFAGLDEERRARLLDRGT